MVVVVLWLWCCSVCGCSVVVCGGGGVDRNIGISGGGVDGSVGNKRGNDMN